MIVVDNFEELIVLVVDHGGIRVVHGSVNQSVEGVLQSRESSNIIVVDCNQVDKRDWWNFIVDKGGTSLGKYKLLSAQWYKDQLSEPESASLITPSMADSPSSDSLRIS